MIHFRVEMEPFLSLCERPPITLPEGISNNRLQFANHFRQASWRARYTKVTEESVPPRKEHPNLHDDFIELTTAFANRGGSVGAGTGTQSSTRSNLRTSRLMREIKSLADRDAAESQYDIYVSESDMSFFKVRNARFSVARQLMLTIWQVVMSGPEGSPYENGAFLLYLHAPEFPTFAPSARFVTKIRHTNVNAHGRVCMSLLDRDWTADTLSRPRRPLLRHRLLICFALTGASRESLTAASACC